MIQTSEKNTKFIIIINQLYRFSIYIPLPDIKVKSFQSRTPMKGPSRIGSVAIFTLTNQRIIGEEEEKDLLLSVRKYLSCE